jgi:surface protein
MNSLFQGCKKLLSVGDLSGRNTSNVTNMGTMFSSCDAIKTLNLTGWDTSKVTNMGSMFNGCDNLESIIGIEDWDTSSLTNLYYTFYECSSLIELDLHNWTTSLVTNMYGMCQNCTSLTSLDLSNWNIDNANLNETSGVLHNCTSLAELTVPDVTVASSLITYLPDRTGKTAGQLNIISEDLTGLETNRLNARNWVVI